MKILAVDVSSVCRTYWETYQSGRLSDGEAFAKSVERVKKAADGFDRVVLALDVGRSLRALHCSTYKANRPDPGEAYRKMVRDAVERLVKDGATAFPNVGEKKLIRAQGLAGEPGYDVGDFYPEADDVIASVVKWYTDLQHASKGADWQLTILTGDTDLWALVDNVNQIYVEKIQNGSDLIVTEKHVQDRFSGIGSWVAEVKALAGDDGDGYKPFPHHEPAQPGEKSKPGIGLKTAIKLLSQYGDDGNGGYSAASVLLRAQLPDGNEYQMPDCHERKCLRAGGQKALEMGYACARMLTDLPLDFARILAEPKAEPVVTKLERSPGRQEKAEQVRGAALVKYEPKSADLLDPNALQPQSLAELFDVGAMVVNSRIYPAIDCPEKAMMVIAEARERRIPYATALRNAYFVRGRLAWSAAFISGLVLRSGVCDVFEVIESTFEMAIVAYKRKGRPERQFEFTLAEAKRAGWVREASDAKADSKWATNPRVMLRWAALREAARAFFPDVVSGMYTPDELRDGHVLDAEFEQTEADFERTPTADASL